MSNKQRRRKIGLLVLFVLVAAYPCSAGQFILPGMDFGPFGEGKVIVSASWGSGPGQIGLLTEPGVQPQGAVSFTVGRDGSIYILDQINQRIQHFNRSGRLMKSHPAGRLQLDNIAISETGDIYVMDSILDRKVWKLGKGKKSWELPKLDELRFVTDLSIEDNDIWVEGGHTVVYPVTSGGKALPKDALKAAEVRGRKGKGPVPFRLEAALASPNEVVLTGENGTFAHVVKSKRDILGIETLDTDRRGRIYLGLLVYKEGPPPDFELLGSCFSVACLGTDGTLFGWVDMPETTYTANLRRLVIGEDGTIYQLQTDESGLRVVAWSIGNGGRK